MTSKSTFPRKLTQVDGLIRPDHYYLTEEDRCFFIGEYTAGMGYAHSATNQLVLNLKKSVDRRNRPEWKYKEKAIQEAATVFRETIPETVLQCATFVPIPPSKAKTDPFYDDRITRLINAIRPYPPLDIREIVVQISSTEAVHIGARMAPDDITQIYRIDPSTLIRGIQAIAIFDDVLTTGAHFKAIVKLLSRVDNLKTIPIWGLFVARRVPEAPNFED
jgi:hypothetical protein